MKPKRKNINMLSTLRVVGTKTPEKVPSFAAVAAGLGNAVEFGVLMASLDLETRRPLLDA
jgi:hypothetical protein